MRSSITPHRAVGERGGEIVGRDFAHERFVVLEVQPLDLVLLGVVLIDRLLVQHGVRRAKIQLGDGLLGGHVHDHEVVPADVA